MFKSIAVGACEKIFSTAVIHGVTTSSKWLLFPPYENANARDHKEQLRKLEQGSQGVMKQSFASLQKIFGILQM